VHRDSSWRCSRARREGEEVGAGRFLLVGLAAMPPALIAARGTLLVLVPR
jgi:hypothetical protein